MPDAEIPSIAQDPDAQRADTPRDDMPDGDAEADGLNSMGSEGAAPESGGRLNHLLSRWGVGLGAGLLNGMLGIGGGILIVPGLIFLRNLPPRTAVPTSLGTVLVLSAGTLAVHVFLSGFQVSWLGGALLLIVGGVAAQAGAWLLTRMSQSASLFAFTLIASAASLNLISQGLGLFALGGDGVGTPPLWSYPAVGIITGLSSGLLGVGGGGMVTLFFAGGFNAPILEVLPLALAVNVVNAGSGVLGQWRTRQVRWREVMRLVPASVAGIALGVALALVVPSRGMKLVCGLFFLYLAWRMMRRGWGLARRNREAPR